MSSRSWTAGRSGLAGRGLIADCEQVLITAAVAEDIPASLVGPVSWLPRARSDSQVVGTPDE
jgi:hypothetical protein